MNSQSQALSSFLPDNEEPVFAAPWEAHAFALAVKMHERGIFSWSEWSQYLSESIRENENDSSIGYYANWLQALEKLLLNKGVVEVDEILQEIRAQDQSASHPDH